MKIVIDIDDDTYEILKNVYERGTGWLDKYQKAIVNGTPLPKGHGRLIDADALKTAYGLERATKYGNESKEQLDNSYSTMMMYEIADMLDYAPTIIEADEKGAEE